MHVIFQPIHSKQVREILFQWPIKFFFFYVTHCFHCQPAPAFEKVVGFIHVTWNFPYALFPF